MRIKKSIQIIALVLVVVFIGTIGACSCDFGGRKTFDFSKLQFKGANYQEMTAFFTSSSATARNSSDVAEINRLAGKMNDCLYELNTEMHLIQLDYYMDTADAQISKDYQEFGEFYDFAISAYFNFWGSLARNTNIPDSMLPPEAREEYIEMSEGASSEIVAIQKKINDVVMRYNGLMRGTKVTVGGKQIGHDDLGQDRTTNNVWYKAYSDAAGDLLIEMRNYYNQIATLQGASSYAEIAYAGYGRDYTPAQSSAMTSHVKRYFKNLGIELLKTDVSTSAVEQSVARLPSFPVAASPAATTKSAFTGKAAFRNFAAPQAPQNGHKELFASGAARKYDTSIELDAFAPYFKSYTAKVSGNMTSAYNFMKECKLQVPTAGVNAVNGAFTGYLLQYDSPYIYQYLVGSDEDIIRFSHEFGHFYAGYMNGQDQAPLDVAEIQSQANELLIIPEFRNIYAQSTVDLMERQQFGSQILSSVQMGCVLDELQQKVYSDKTITRGEQVTALFESLLNEYGAYVPAARYDFKYWWALVEHSFSSPFYYISYAMSSLPALEVYINSLSDRPAAIKQYQKIIINGNSSYTFTGLLSNVGLSSPFADTGIKKIADTLRSKYGI